MRLVVDDELRAEAGLDYNSRPPIGTVVRLELPGRRQEIWESALEDPGGWHSTAPNAAGRLTWHELVLRAAELRARLVVLVAADDEAYHLGWTLGRADFAEDLHMWSEMTLNTRGRYPGGNPDAEEAHR